jgi:hypothetical protein
MTLSSSPSTSIGWMAVAVGVVQLVGLVSLIVFFAIGELFGALNDVCIGLAGILSGVLAWMLFAAMQAGARGYLLKGAEPEATLRAIRTVASGEAIFSPSVARRVMDFFPAASPTPPPKSSPS